MDDTRLESPSTAPLIFVNRGNGRDPDLKYFTADSVVDEGTWTGEVSLAPG